MLLNEIVSPGFFFYIIPGRTLSSDISVRIVGILESGILIQAKDLEASLKVVINSSVHMNIIND